MMNIITGFLIGLFLAVKPAFIVPVLGAVCMVHLTKIIYIYVKYGLIKF